MRHSFTDRQQQVVRLIAAGLTNEEAGEQLGISAGAVRNHANALRWKLGVQTRREIPVAYMRLTGDNPFPTPDEVAA